MALKIVSTSNINNPDGSIKEVLVQFVGESTAFVDYISGTVKLPADFRTVSEIEQVERVLGAFKKEFFPEPFNADLIQELDDKVIELKDETETRINEVNVQTEQLVAKNVTLNDTINALSKQVLRSDIPEEDYQELISIYPEWAADVDYKVGDIVRWKGKAYEATQTHYSHVASEPDKTPAVFNELIPKVIETEDGEQVEIIPDWEKPLYAEVGYNTGDKVMFEGQIYESKVDKNVWKPTEYGWVLV